MQPYVYDNGLFNRKFSDWNRKKSRKAMDFKSRKMELFYLFMALSPYRNHEEFILLVF